MKTGKLLTKWLAVLCAAMLMISLFAIPVFADETTTAAETTSSPEDTTAAEEESSTAQEETTTAEGESTTAAGSSNNTTTNTPADNTALIVWIIVGAVVLIVAVVLCIKFREKIVKGLRVYKSEFKKVSWLSWEQTRKSTFVVVVVLLVFAAIICVLDIALFKGFDLILDGFKGLFK